MALATDLASRPGLLSATIDDLPVWYAAGSFDRAQQAAHRVARARAWIDARLGQAPAAQILVLDAATWPLHATFPVFGMPHYTDPQTLAIAATPAPFLDGIVEGILAHTTPDGRRRMVEAYGTPPDPMRFFDLLVVHELAHLYHFHRGARLHEGWLAELHCNLVLHGYVHEQEPDALARLTTLPDVGARRPASQVRNHPLRAMHTDVAIDPETYGWYQMNLHCLAAALWNAHGVDVLHRFEEALFTGQEVSTTRLGEVSPMLADFSRRWPRWQEAGL